MKTIKTKNSVSHNVVAKVRNIPKSAAKNIIKTADNKVQQGLKDSTEPQGSGEMSAQASASQQMVDSGEDMAKRTVQGTYDIAKETYQLVKKHRQTPKSQNLSDIATEKLSALQDIQDIFEPLQADIKMRPQSEVLTQNAAPTEPPTPSAFIKQRTAKYVKASTQAVKTKERVLHSTPTETANEISNILQLKEPHVTSAPIQQPTAQAVKTATPTIKTKEAFAPESAPCSVKNTAAPHALPRRHSAPTATPQKTAKASSAVKSVSKNTTYLPDAHGSANVKSGKALQKRTIKTRSNSATKVIQRTVKQDVRGIKTAKQTAAKAKQTAKLAQKTAQQIARTAKVAAQKTAQAVKVLAKAVVSAIKAFLLAVKSLAAAIAAIGGTALFIILIISLVAILAGSVLGIFMAAEPSGHGMPISEVTSQLNEDYYKKISEIQANVKHDKLEIRASDGVMGIKWEDVLAVYSCKLAASDMPIEVITFDAQKKEALRSIMWDMNAVKHTTHVETKYIDVPALDEDGNQLYDENDMPLIDKESYTETTLIITVEHKTPNEMAAAYAFTPKQYKALALLKESGYASLWAKLLGGLVNGGGEIITPDTDWTGTDIFAWPLPQTFSISSRYGYRKDPFTGKISFHSGTDIVAPYGTPILAAAGGMVTVANATDPWGMSYGYHVKINHGGGQETLYAHASSICVTAGQTVQAGEVIGFVGSTGNSTGNHLHFEVRINGSTTDALGYFK